MPQAKKSQRYVTDESGDRVGIILPLDQYQELLEAAEELDDIRAYDDARASGDEAVDFETAVSEIEASRR